MSLRSWWTAINSLELVALKQGNGFSPKVEPAPLDEAMNEVTFPPDPALVGRINAELQNTKSDLPLVVNDYVAGFINYFSNSPAGHAHLRASLERAGKYKDMISRTLKQYGVPQDLIYQAVAESGFQPQALNRRSGAGGMWQFMPFAGAYGLERNGFFDERFDPEKSTIAYAKYMKYLYDQFGDWYLAMAAYDWGAGNVQRAVARTGYADFWQLYRHNALPGETKNYVPGILAAVIMAKNPKQYGLTDVVPDAAGDLGHSDDGVFDQPAAGGGCDELERAGDRRAEPGAAAADHATRHSVRPAPADGHKADLHGPGEGHSGGEPRELAFPCCQARARRSTRSRRRCTRKASEIATVNEIAAGDPPGAGDELVIPVATAAGRAAALHDASWRHAGHSRGPLRCVRGGSARVEPSVVQQADAGTDAVCGRAGAAGADGAGRAASAPHGQLRTSATDIRRVRMRRMRRLRLHIRRRRRHTSKEAQAAKIDRSTSVTRKEVPKWVSAASHSKVKEGMHQKRCLLFHCAERNPVATIRARAACVS